jgi:hypothetical protein
MRGQQKKKKTKVGSFQLDIEPRKAIIDLLARRRKRAREVAKGVGRAGISIGAPAIIGTIREPNFRTGLSLLTVGGLFVLVAPILAIVGYRGHYGVRSKKIKQATHLIGTGLAKEAQTNNKLRELLKNNRYVIIDRRGDIRGTNRSQKCTLGIGRIRLESKKILEEEY